MQTTISYSLALLGTGFVFGLKHALGDLLQNSGQAGRMVLDGLD